MHTLLHEAVVIEQAIGWVNKSMGCAPGGGRGRVVALLNCATPTHLPAMTDMVSFFRLTQKICYYSIRPLNIADLIALLGFFLSLSKGLVAESSAAQPPKEGGWRAA